MTGQRPIKKRCFAIEVEGPLGEKGIFVVDVNGPDVARFFVRIQSKPGLSSLD
jgi:hypothetical protein